MLKEIDALLTPEFFTGGYASFNKQYKAKAIEVFGWKLARQVIADLGVNTVEDISASVAEIVPKAVQGTCECSTADSWCNPMGNACAMLIQCDPAPAGCGSFWCSKCDGNCPG